jgi:hypothetical protein
MVCDLDMPVENTDLVFVRLSRISFLSFVSI